MRKSANNSHQASVATSRKPALYVELLEDRNLLSANVLESVLGAADTDALAAELRGSFEVIPLIMTSDDPALHVVDDADYQGVGQLTVDFGIFGTGLCSGTLLVDDNPDVNADFFLTAAHCVEDSAPGDLTVTFTVAGYGQIDVGVKAITVHPQWKGKLLWGNDVAVLELDLAGLSPEDADAYGLIQGYDIYRDNDDGEIGPVSTKVGYGESGFGALGADPLMFPAGEEKRSGQNTYDATAQPFANAFGKQIRNADKQLLYDFDSTPSANDALGTLFGVVHPGLGLAEGSAGRGDSGGPTFVNGKIAGITSYGISFGLPTDVNNEFDSSWGEIGGDTRVSAFVDFIDGVLSGAGDGGGKGGGKGNGNGKGNGRLFVDSALAAQEPALGAERGIRRTGIGPNSFAMVNDASIVLGFGESRVPGVSSTTESPAVEDESAIASPSPALDVEAAVPSTSESEHERVGDAQLDGNRDEVLSEASLMRFFETFGAL